MAWQLTPYAVAPLVAAAVSAILLVYVWPHRAERLAQVFMALVLAILAWSLAYAIQLSQTTLPGQLYWLSLGLSIGGAIPTIWVVFTTVYTEAEHRLTPGVIALLLLDPMGFAALLWTNGYHGLVWSSARLAAGPGLALDFGIGYYLHIAYAYLLVVVGIGMLLAVYLRSSAIYRRQAGLLVVGAVVPLSANVAFTFGLSPVPGLDFTTTTFAVTGLVFALALFRFDFLDLTPVARRHVLDEFGNGVVVVDVEGRAVHLNRVAREVLPNLELGDRIVDRFDVRTIDAIEGHVETIDDGRRTRYFECSVAPLRDFRDRAVGRAIAMRDATTDYEYEQRLEVVNRLLRHNLRNDMNKVVGWASVGEQDTDGEAAEAFRQIRAVAEDVAETSRTARRIEETLDARAGEPVTVDAVATIDSVVTTVRERWPGHQLSLDVPDEAPVKAPTPDLLSVAFRNLVENAIEHGDRSPVHVAVELRTAAGSGGEWTVLEVADDGPGIPEMELEALHAGEETALRHGSGLGLWLVQWIVETAGGELEFAENDPRGTVVRLRLQPA